MEQFGVEEDVVLTPLCPGSDLTGGRSRSGSWKLRGERSKDLYRRYWTYTEGFSFYNL